jgi:selenium metabolism protein YedF
MSEQVLDERGKACPLPVVETRRELLGDATAGVRVIVDNRAAVENVSRLAQSMGRTVRVEEKSGTEFHLVIAAAVARSGAQSGPAGAMPSAPPGGCGNVVLIGSTELGTGDAELGRTLMRMFVFTLKEVEPPPSAILFVNSGVRLTTEGSPLLDDIRELADRGVEVLSCGTCLDYYGLKEKLQVGKVTNMFQIVTLLSTADRLVRP